MSQMFTDSEKAWYQFVKKNYLHLFPKLTSLSRYHRRSKSLQQLTEVIRQILVRLLGADLEGWHLIDSMPVPVCLRVRASRNMRFCEEFYVDNSLLYGYCASEKMKIYGFNPDSYQNHLIVTKDGISVYYTLAPAVYHDVTIAVNLVETYRQSR